MGQKAILQLFMTSLVVFLIAAGGVLLFNHNQAKPTTTYDKNYPAVTIYLKSDASEEQISTLLKEISEVKGLIRVQYLTKQQAIDQFKEKIKDNPIQKNLFPDSALAEIIDPTINVYLKDSELIETIGRIARGKTYVKEIIYPLKPQPARS